MSSFFDLNDPFETMRQFDEDDIRTMLEDRRRALLENYSPEKVDKDIAAHERLFARLSEHLFKLGCCSLTENPSCPLMWSHYADGHRGFLLEFEINESVSEDVWPVRYVVDPAVETDFSSMDLPIDEYIRIAKKLYATKHTAWSYEREWRFLKYFDQIGDQRGSASEYPGKLVSIRFGTRMRVLEKSAIARIVQGLYGEDGIKILSVVQQHGTYDFFEERWPHTSGVGLSD
jgi:hypothetical protein